MDPSNYEITDDGLLKRTDDEEAEFGETLEFET